MPWPVDLGEVVAWRRAPLEDDLRRCRHRARPISTRWSGSPTTYPSRERFLSELTLDPPDATSDEAGPPHRDEDYLILSTIHSAKGQEWKSVFVLNCVDGCIPSDLATGSTRGDRGGAAAALCRDDARADELDAGRAAALLRARPAAQRRPSRLARPHALHPAAAAEAFRAGDLAAAAAEAARAAREGPAVDLAARMRAMWR